MKMVGVEFCFTNLKNIQIRKIVKLMFSEKATKFWNVYKEAWTKIKFTKYLVKIGYNAFK